MFSKIFKIFQDNSEKQTDKMVKFMSSLYRESLIYARDVIEGKLTSAEKDNEFIYHMLIKENLPPPETLSRPMVKPASWDPIFEEELFADVVPDEAFISSSNYSEKTDGLWRDLTTEIDEKNSELEKCRDALKVAGIDMSLETDRSILPESLVEAVAKNDQIKTILAELELRRNKIQEIECELQKDLDATNSLLKSDGDLIAKIPEKEQKQFKSDPGWAALSKRVDEIEKAFDKSKKPSRTFFEAASVTVKNLEIIGKGLDHVNEYLPEIDVNEGLRGKIYIGKRIFRLLNMSFRSDESAGYFFLFKYSQRFP